MKITPVPRLSQKPVPALLAESTLVQSRDFSQMQLGGVLSPAWPDNAPSGSCEARETCSTWEKRAWDSCCRPEMWPLIAFTMALYLGACWLLGLDNSALDMEGADQ